VSTAALGLLCAAADWYLIGGDAPDSIRFYRLDRMDELHVGEKDEGAPRIDVAEEWCRARARFQERFTPMTAVLEVQQCALGRLRSLVSIDRIDSPGAPEGGDTAASGRSGCGAEMVRVRVIFGDVSHATEVLPGLAAHVRVVEPVELKQALRALAERLRAAAG